jgi:hypothetical protein
LDGATLNVATLQKCLATLATELNVDPSIGRNEYRKEVALGMFYKCVLFFIIFSGKLRKFIEFFGFRIFFGVFEFFGEVFGVFWRIFACRISGV